MDFDTLRLFVAAIDKGHIAPAARQFGISPSLASRRISALEAELGTRLLFRTTRSLAPTEAGAVLLTWARGAMLDWGRLSEELGALRGHVSGLVRIATNDFVTTSYLPSIIADFTAKHPDVSVSVSMAIEPARLLEGGCDIALHAGRRPDASLVGRRLFEYRRRVVAAPSYLAKYPAPEMPAALFDHRCLTHTVSEPGEWSFMEPEGALFTQPIRSHVSCDSWTLLTELAIKGAGVARLSDILVAAPIADGRLVELFPALRSVYADGDPPGLWILFADRAMPLRIRLFADHAIDHIRSRHGEFVGRHKKAG